MARGRRQFSFLNGIGNLIVKPLRAFGKFVEHPLGFMSFAAIAVASVIFALITSEGQKAEERQRAQDFIDLKAEFANEAQSADFHNGRLSIIEGGNLMHDLPYIDYNFDFTNRTISADGADSADRLFTFPEFEDINPGRIEEAIQTACEIAQNTTNVMDAFAAQNNGEQHPNRTEIESRVHFFEMAHCPR